MSEEQLQPGTVIANKYSIVEPIGVGGSATVYRAQQVGMTQEVAIKMMHSEHPDSENEKIRFGREAQLVMKLQHPHVVPLLDYGHTDEDVPFLVFALLKGRSLEAKIRSEGAMPWAQMGRLSVQILRALEKAHSMGVVHRDIKPANIFLSNGILGEVAQVLDFGLAKMVKEPDTELTQAGALLGTPRYMAPEQVRGETITHAADIYSFGLVMAEMLLGRPLVTGAKELDIYVAQGSDKPIFVPSEVLSTPYGNIVQRAVNKKVEVRYHMASQMLADVEAVLENLEGPQEDIEADLDATRMIDPSAAAILSNPHAEKMRRVLNAAAAKKSADLAKKAAESADAVEKAERPTRVPDKSELVDEPAVPKAPIAPKIDNPGAPPPIPDAAYDDEPSLSALNGLSTEPSSNAQPEPLPLSGALPASSNPRGALATPPPGGPTSEEPGTDPLAFPSGMRQDMASASAQPFPVARTKPRQTGLMVALLFVVLLIAAGVGAILWMLGFLPV